VDIDLDFDRIRETSGLSAVHCVVGTVAYPERDAQGRRCTGMILYVKASVTGDEPEDIKEFRSRFSDFPHQSTSDQFFDEPQFESYRALGLHVARSIFEHTYAADLVYPPEPAEVLERLFQELHRKWYPPSSAAEGVLTRLAEAYSALADRLADDPELRYLDSQFMMGAPPSPRPTDELILRRGRFFCLDCIQLMQNVAADLHFIRLRERENPNNAGWMAVFRHWTRQPDFQEVWQQVRTSYNPLFRHFFESI
jgi:hypothetical protein